MRWKLIIFTAYLTSFCGESGELLWFIFSPHSNDFFLKKESSVNRVELLASCTAPTRYSAAPPVTYFFYISSDIKSDSINVGKQNWCIFVRNAVNSSVNFWKNIGELRRIILITAFNAILTKIHRIHRIS